MLQLIPDILVSQVIGPCGAIKLSRSACDGETQSEIVIPVRIPISSTAIGVLDIDSTVLGTFDEVDSDGLQRIVEILGKSCEWR